MSLERIKIEGVRPLKHYISHCETMNRQTSLSDPGMPGGYLVGIPAGSRIFWLMTAPTEALPVDGVPVETEPAFGRASDVLRQRRRSPVQSSLRNCVGGIISVPSSARRRLFSPQITILLFSLTSSAKALSPL